MTARAPMGGNKTPGGRHGDPPTTRSDDQGLLTLWE